MKTRRCLINDTIWSVSVNYKYVYFERYLGDDYTAYSKFHNHLKKVYSFGGIVAFFHSPYYRENNEDVYFVKSKADGKLYMRFGDKCIDVSNLSSFYLCNANSKVKHGNEYYSIYL